MHALYSWGKYYVYCEVRVCPTVRSFRKFERRWSRCNTVDLYFGDALFESRPGHQLSWLGPSMVFLQSLRENAGIVPLIGLGHFLSYPIHQSAYSLTLYILHYESVVNNQKSFAWLRQKTLFSPQLKIEDDQVFQQNCAPSIFSQFFRALKGKVVPVLN
jgi:hypothetical protein